MLCGGVTVYAPLARWGAGPGKVVGVVGIGGLGHFGVLFSKALGAYTVAISSSDAKKADAMKLGADAYVSTAKGSKDVRQWFGKMDLLCITANVHDVSSYAKYLAFLKTRGTAIMVGAPESPMAIGAGSLLGGEKQLGGLIEGGAPSSQGRIKLTRVTLLLGGNQSGPPSAPSKPSKTCSPSSPPKTSFPGSKNSHCTNATMPSRPSGTIRSGSGPC